MPKPRGDVEISSSFYVLFLSQVWWDVYCVNEFVGGNSTPSPPPSSDREVYRKLTAERINTLQLNNPQHTHNTHLEAKAIKSIKTKLKDNEDMIAHTEKGAP